jgi:hypothetical protein
VTEPSAISALLKLRSYLFESIAIAADEIADIDCRIAILRSQELEADLIQAESGAV